MVNVWLIYGEYMVNLWLIYDPYQFAQSLPCCKWRFQDFSIFRGGDVSKRSQLALLRRGAQLVLCTAQRFKEKICGSRNPKEGDA